MVHSSLGKVSGTLDLFIITNVPCSSTEVSLAKNWGHSWHFVPFPLYITSEYITKYCWLSFKNVSRFNTILIKISASYFVAINKLILKCVWRGRRPRIGNMILKEKNRVRGLTLSNLNTYHKEYCIIKMVWYVGK